MNYPDLPPGYYWHVTGSHCVTRVELRKRVCWFFHQEIYSSYVDIARRYPKLEQKDIDFHVASLWNLHKQKRRNKTQKS